MTLQVKCSILKRIVYILDYLWLILVGGGLYSVGAEEIRNSIVLFLLSALFFIGSYEVGYIVTTYIIRIELGKDKSKNE